MVNLHRARELTGYIVQASDGVIGIVRELYFDDAAWVVRYAVVDVRKWLFRKYVLLSTQALGRPDRKHRRLQASVTMDQVGRSPKIYTDQPIARQAQEQMHRHYGWDFYWGAEAMTGSPDPEVFSPMETLHAIARPFDPHLRATRAIQEHQVMALDGPAGDVEDLLVDEATWTIRYLVVRLDDGSHVAMPTRWIRQIRLESARVYVDMTAATVRGCLPADVTGEEVPAAEAVAASRHG